MPKKNIDIINKVILNENLYIYIKPSNKFYPKRTIKQLFDTVKEDKGTHKVLYSLLNNSYNTDKNKLYKLSILILSFFNTPSFLSEPIKNWEEKKLGYLFLFDFKKYLVLLRRNIGGIQPFINSLETLDYEVISTLFIEEKTLLEKFTLHNLDISTKAMRSKAVESDNLVDNYNYIGSNTYTISHLRLNNDNDRYLLSLNTSRISKTGEKVSIGKLGDWSYELIEAISNFITKDTFLDNFARPYDYKKERDKLTPITVTLLLTKLIEDISLNKIIYVKYNHVGKSKSFNVISIISSLSVSINVFEQTKVIYEAEATIKPAYLRGIEVRLNEKSITINSQRLRKIKLYKESGDNEGLIDYFNRNSCYVINFDQCDYVYSNKKLFKDSLLLGSIEYFMKVFEPDPLLENVTSEKGDITSASTNFDNTSIFNYIENKYSSSDFLVLDDLGNEWADHISIKDLTVCFIHSKFNTTNFSATAFTDIIGQGLKNIGNIFSVDNAIRQKRTIWLEQYRSNNIQSKIERLRKGANVDAFIDRYIKIKLEVNAKRALCLAINFISKNKLEENLIKLKNEEIFGERKQSIQILWFLSSLIANCKDNNVELKILCKP